MNNAPERIWASAGETWDGEVEGTSWDDGLYTRMQENSYDLEYIRADLVPQWQPIKTAPRNKHIMLYWHGMQGDEVENGVRIALGHINDYGKLWVDKSFDNEKVWPTHWMPTPTPPTALKQEP